MNNNKYIYLLLFSISTLLAAGCKKFLDIEQSSTSVNPTKIADFQEMLNNDSLGINDNILLDLSTDDVMMKDNQLTTENVFQRSYLWNSTIWNPADEDWMYRDYYSRILQLNIILDRIGDATMDSLNTEKNRMNIISEALIHRCWYYLQLANIYGPAYNAATAATDLAVPLVLVPNATSLPARATIANMYRTILANLATAVNNPYLPARGATIVHPGKASGFALLARTHLYMGNYDSALVYSDSALALYNTIIDYNTGYTKPNQFSDLSTNPEVLLGRISKNRGYYTTYSVSFQIDSTFKVLLGTSDTRFTLQFSLDSYLSAYVDAISIIVSDNSVSVPEVMLTKAECLARKGDADGAGTLIDQLREKRLKTGSFSTRTYTTDNILQYVLDERRRELFYRGGLRFFDLKRLNKEDAFKKDLTRMSGSTILATLPAGSPKYLFPFANVIISNNTNIVQNPR